MNILAIVDGLPGGAQKHATEVLKILNEKGYNISVFEEPFHFSPKSLDEIEKHGLSIHDINYYFSRQMP